MTRPNGRLLALDLGSVRVGVAVSDPLGLTASPSGWFPRRGPVKDVAAVRDLVVEHEAVGVVVGHPLRLTGEAGDTARESEAFAERLRAGGIDVPVILWDERLTTVQAERAMIEGGVRREKRRGAVDAVAAAILLQSYLDAAGSSST